jgi:2-aminoadipate transaminase
MGVTYTRESREEVASIIEGTGTVILEDDAYGELSFDSPPPDPIAALAPESTVLSGSFSKVFSPGMRCGWMVGPDEVMKKINTAKEALDLHSNYLSQRIIYQWLEENDLDAQIQRINSNYREKRDLMLRLLDEMMPEEVKHTHPRGGLFIWMTLPKGSTMELFNKTLEKKVAIMPGPLFYTDDGGHHGARLNFSASSKENIEEGVTRLAEVTREYLSSL